MPILSPHKKIASLGIGLGHMRVSEVRNELDFITATLVSEFARLPLAKVWEDGGKMAWITSAP